jgi:hypothetical protein
MSGRTEVSDVTLQVIVCELDEDKCHGIKINPALPGQEDWYVGFGGVDECLFKCSRRAFEKGLVNNAFLHGHLAQSELRKECERARKVLWDDTQCVINLPALHQNQDCWCELTRLDHEDVAKGGVLRMPKTRKMIFEWQTLNSISEDDVYMIILFGTCRCPHHDVDLETKCPECEKRVCHLCLGADHKNGCATCEAKSMWKTRQEKRECDLCRRVFSYDRLVKRGIERTISFWCESVTDMFSYERYESYHTIGIDVFKTIKDQG